MPGVQKVTSGWHKFREINTVTYDPDLISTQQMIEVLEEADTYIGIAD